VDENTQFFRFREGHLEPVTEAQENEVQLEVADSWLVEDGAPVALMLTLKDFQTGFRKSAQSAQSHYQLSLKRLEKSFRTPVATFRASSFTVKSTSRITFS